MRIQWSTLDTQLVPLEPDIQVFRKSKHFYLQTRSEFDLAVHDSRSLQIFQWMSTRSGPCPTLTFKDYARFQVLYFTRVKEKYNVPDHERAVAQVSTSYIGGVWRFVSSLISLLQTLKLHPQNWINDGQFSFYSLSPGGGGSNSSTVSWNKRDGEVDTLYG